MHADASAPVVVGIDGSHAAIDAVLWAVDEAISRDVPLLLVHVMPVAHAPERPIDPAMLEGEYAESTLRAASAVVEAADRPVKVETDILWGRADLAMIEQSAQASLVCVGSVGIGFVARKFLGSTAAALAERAHCPVAILRSPRQVPSTGVDWIVVPVDGAPGNAEVVEYAMHEAELRHAPILAVGVWDDDFGNTSYAELDQRVAEMTQRHPGVHVYPVATRSRVAGFLAENRGESVQLAVVGANAATQVAQIIGPHSRPLIAHGQCSVLVVR
ncbi:universal stress protein [Mycolicibacterium hodleri]|uniref:Universal stress protein n=1 Tax=Mycolicibacterium hodleri TaxID=49897 RepID=A0A502E5F5_9MYCO|nr:universal stress protein [Mycolicibacterium hodleri]TPG32727.1 universal stress protein [Mycolicibacterium hodleri]